MNEIRIHYRKNKYFLFVEDGEKRKKRGISPTENAFYPHELTQLFIDAGYTVESISMRDFLHPATPPHLFLQSILLERLLKRCR